MRYGGNRGDAFSLPLGSARTVAELLLLLAIPRSHVGMVLVNNARVSDFSRPLKGGDDVKIFGLVAGG